MKILPVTLAILACLFLFSVFAQAGNILSNPGFESGDFPPPGWSDWSGSESQDPKDGIAGFPAPKELAHSGNKAVGKILYGGTERWGGFSQTVDVTPGKAYEASGWVLNKKNDVALSGGARVFIEVKCLDSNGNELRVSKSGAITQPTNWTRLSVRGVIPQNTKQAIFSFVMIGNKRSSGKVIFDDASLDTIR